MYCSKTVAISRLVWVIMFSISAECQLFTFSIFEENTGFNNISITTDNMLNLSNYSVVRCGSQCLQSVNCSWISYLESSHFCTLHFNRDIITMKALPGMTHMTVGDVGDTRDRNLRLYAYNGTMFAGDVIHSGGMDADDWLRTSAVQVTNTKWNVKTYSQMFFLDHEYLMAIFDDRPWKGKLLQDTDDWIAEASALGGGGWNVLTLPFVDKTRTTLYMVRPDGKLCSTYFPGKSDLILRELNTTNINWKTEFIRLFSDSNNQLFAVTPAGDMYRGVIPETSPVNTWLNDSTKVGGSEWLGYKFLSCLPSGVFLAVKTSGEMYIGNPPQPGRAWLPEAVFLGRGWDEFQFLLVRPDRYVLQVDSIFSYFLSDTSYRNLRLYAYNGIMFAGEFIHSGGMDADDWLRTSAVQVTNTNWNVKTYHQMFFLDHEYLMAIFDDSPWKGKLVQDTDDWITEASALGGGGWNVLTWPFVDKTRTTLYLVRPDGKLSSVFVPGKSDLISEHYQSNINWKTEFIRLFSDSNNQLYAVTPAGDMYRGLIPETSPVNTWLNDSTKVGGSEWLGYKFLSCLPSGVFLAVKTSGEMYIGNPPQPGRAWLPEAVFLGRGWDEFQFLLVRPDRYVLQVDSIFSYFGNELYILINPRRVQTNMIPIV